MAGMWTMHRLQNRTKPTMGRANHARNATTRRKQLYYAYIQRRTYTSRPITKLQPLSKIHAQSAQKNQKKIEILYVWGIRRRKGKTTLSRSDIRSCIQRRPILLEKNKRRTRFIPIKNIRATMEIWRQQHWRRNI